jgi:hypothetical protein
MTADSAKMTEQLRRNWDTKTPVKFWKESEVQLYSAQEARMARDGASDIALMVAAAKIVDPASVAREGEITMQDLARSANQQVRGWANKFIMDDGRLAEAAREETLGVVERTARQRWFAYEREVADLRALYGAIPGVDPEVIFGVHNAPTFLTLESLSTGPRQPGGIGTDPVAGGTQSAFDLFNPGGPGG